MLDTIHLDKSDFTEMFEKNKQMMKLLLPFIDVERRSEPAVTLLEMMTMLSDIQNFNIDRISSEHIEKYLILLGIKRQERTCARVLVNGLPQSHCHIMQGTRFFTEDSQSPIIYELQDEAYIIKNLIMGHYYQIAGEQDIMRFYRNQHFSLKDVDEQYIYIMFENELPKIPFSIYFYLQDQKRNLPNDYPYQEASLTYEYYSEYGWQKCIDVTDQTYGLMYSGAITLATFYKSEKLKINKVSGYCLRLGIKQQYEILPQIENMILNPLFLKQTHTYIYQRHHKYRYSVIPCLHDLETTGHLKIFQSVEEGWQDISLQCHRDETSQIHLPQDIEQGTDILIVSIDSIFHEDQFLFPCLGISTQKMQLSVSHVARHSLKVMIKQNDLYKPFEHYDYDENENMIILGNGKNYPLLPSDAETLMIVGLETTLDVQGRVRKHTLICEKDDIRCSHFLDSYGGQARESLDDYKQRVINEYKMAQVPFQKYSDIVFQTPYLTFKNVKILYRKDFYHSPQAEGLVVIVQKQTRRPLTYDQINLISEHFKKSLYVNTQFEILSMQYRPVDIQVKIEFLREDVSYREHIQEVIYEYIERLDIDEWTMRKSELMVCFLQKSFVKDVKLLKIFMNHQSIETYEVRADTMLYIQNIECY